MMKRNILTLLAFLLLQFGAAPAQTILSMVPGDIAGLPDTVQYGDTIHNMTVQVVNQGPLSVIAGSLVDLQAQPNFSGTPFSIATLTIPALDPFDPGDTLVVPLDMFVVTPSNSNNGSNVMVIWPTAPGTQPGDTAKDDYYVDGIVGITDAALISTSAIVYPNPTNGPLNLQGIEQFSMEARVEIIALDGTVVRQWGRIDSQINLQGLAAGAYILQIYDRKRIFRNKVLLR